jgi:hypothetical protein
MMAAAAPCRSSTFEYLFRSAYTGRPLLAFLDLHDVGCLYCVSVFVRRLLASERVKVLRSCTAVCGIASYRRAHGLAADQADGSELTALIRNDMVRAFKAGHVGTLRSLWESCAAVASDAARSDIRWSLMYAITSCRDDSSILYAAESINIPILEFGVVWLLSIGKRSLLMGIASRQPLGSTLHHSLTIFGLKQGDVEMVRSVAPVMDFWHRTMRDWFLERDAVSAAVKTGDMEALDILLSRGYELSPWEGLLAEAVRNGHVPMVAFLMARRNGRELSNEVVREAFSKGDDAIIDLLYPRGQST